MNEMYNHKTISFSWPFGPRDSGPVGKPIIPHLLRYQGFTVVNYSVTLDALYLGHPRLSLNWGHTFRQVRILNIRYLVIHKMHRFACILYLQYRSCKNVIFLDIGSQSKGFSAENFKPHFGIKCISPVVFLPAAQPD